MALAAAALAWSLNCTTRDNAMVIVPLVLIEAVTASTVIGQQQEAVGAFIRYPLVVLFCLPILPSLWRSGILSQGGFRDYTLYLLWGLISVSYSLLPEISFGRLLSSALPFFAIAAIAASINTGGDVRRVMGIMLAGCGIVVLANVVVLAAFPSAVSWLADPESGIQRFEGIFSQPNEIGALMLATVGSGFAYWPIARGWRKFFCAAVMAGAVALAAMADSRSALLAVAAGVFCYAIWRHGAAGLLVTVIAIVSVAALMLAKPSLLNYADRGLQTFTGRNVAWEYALRSIEEHPFLGYGYEVDGQIFQRPDFSGWDEVWDEGPWSSIHQGYLTRAVSLGIFAALFWLFIMIRPIIACLRTGGDPWELRPLIMLTLLPLLIFNFSESIPDCRSMEGVLMALAWSALERQRLYVREVAAQQAREADAFEAPVLRAVHG
jgi:exopolysaccharide production protein ExoQ